MAEHGITELDLHGCTLLAAIIRGCLQGQGTCLSGGCADGQAAILVFGILGIAHLLGVGIVPVTSWMASEG